MFKALAEWGFSDYASAIGGLFIVVFLVAEGIRKVIGHTDWAKQRKAEKEKKQKEADREQYREFTDEFVREFVPPLVKHFEDADKEINGKLDLVLNSSNNLLRKEMTDIYYRYLPYKRILQYDKKQFIRLKTDYENQGGNSYIGEIWKEIEEWEVVMDIEELDK